MLAHNWKFRHGISQLALIPHLTFHLNLLLLPTLSLLLILLQPFQCLILRILVQIKQHPPMLLNLLQPKLHLQLWRLFLISIPHLRFEPCLIHCLVLTI